MTISGQTYYETVLLRTEKEETPERVAHYAEFPEIKFGCAVMTRGEFDADIKEKAEDEGIDFEPLTDMEWAGMCRIYEDAVDVNQFLIDEFAEWRYAVESLRERRKEEEA